MYIHKYTYINFLIFFSYLCPCNRFFRGIIYLSPYLSEKNFLSYERYDENYIFNNNSY